MLLKIELLWQMFFRNLKNIHRAKLSPYFTEKKRLENLVAVLKIQMVFLSPGAGNETYFEHVYLSSYLGFKLVEGSDLLVREGYVWLKTIDQLERVDVISSVLMTSGVIR
jgi:uncharacterized circularly permuted ATP-grasp superfamily protein